MSHLLEIKQLRTSFSTLHGKVDAIRGVDLYVNENEILGIVGESGSGKSVTMKSVMKLLPRSAKVSAETLSYKGEDLTAKKERELQKYRGKEMAMIFQDPMTALNPLRTIGYHLTEVIRRYRKVSKAEAEKIAVEMLRQVGERKYSELNDPCEIALWSCRIAFTHPKSGKRMEFIHNPPEIYPWTEV